MLSYENLRILMDIGKGHDMHFDHIQNCYPLPNVWHLTTSNLQHLFKI